MYEDRIKNGKREGKILFSHILKEKETEFKIEFDSVRISNPINTKMTIIITLINTFFILSPCIKIYYNDII